MPNKPDISVIIPTYNRCEILGRCLDSLAAQTLDKSRFEIVICDDGSKDGTASLVQSRLGQMPIKFLQQPNSGPAKARNNAIKQAKADHLLIINDDTILESNAVAMHLANKAYKVIVLGNFRTYRDHVKKDFFTALVDSTGWIFFFHRLNKRVDMSYDAFITCNLSIAKNAFEECGYFNETFPSPAGEDIEVGYRMWKKGYQIVFDPSIVSYHDNLYTPASYVRLRAMRGLEDLRLLNYHPELIGRFVDASLASARRWYMQLKTNPAELKQRVAQSQVVLEKLVAAYQTTEQKAEKYKIISKCYRYIDELGMTAYVSGLLESEALDKVIRQHAIPTPPGVMGRTAQDILVGLKKAV